MQMISENKADMMQLDPGMGYTAGQYFTMMPLVAEKYDMRKFKEMEDDAINSLRPSDAYMLQ